MKNIISGLTDCLMMSNKNELKYEIKESFLIKFSLYPIN